jgi:hypothetical protein
MLHTRDYFGLGDGKVADKTKGERPWVWANSWAVHVDLSNITGTADVTSNVKALAERCGVAFVGVKAEDVFEDSLSEKLGGVKTETDREQLGIILGNPGEAKGQDHFYWHRD